ncbi:uncharacterized protein LOC144749326 isoform X1 [Ciona intestinalis]
MLNTIAYWAGFGSNDTPIVDDNLSFITKETGDWTLVDLENQNDAQSNYPTPPPSPRIEHSWLITPPPCFTAEASMHVGALNARENLLIEHPSMFVKPAEPAEEPKNKTESRSVQRHKGAPTSLRRSHRRASRQASCVISQMHRSNQIKRDVARSNKAMQKMRQIVHQPRKRC